MQTFRVLCLGDVVGVPAVEALRRRLPSLQRENGVQFTVVNGENARLGQGNGLSAEDAEALFDAGADVITGGNHSFRQRSVYGMLDERPELLRPINASPAAPGHGAVLVQAGGVSVLVLNAVGQSFMDPPAENPIFSLERALAREKGRYDLAILDFHAEATGEKFALASLFDRKIGIIFGTHTHVQTADEQILPGGSAYITDAGMCGPRSSCLGVASECIAEKMRTGMPQKFCLAETPLVLQGILVTLECRPGGMVPLEIRRISEPM